MTTKVNPAGRKRVGSFNLVVFKNSFAPGVMMQFDDETWVKSI